MKRRTFLKSLIGSAVALVVGEKLQVEEKPIRVFRKEDVEKCVIGADLAIDGASEYCYVRWAYISDINDWSESRCTIWKYSDKDEKWYIWREINGNPDNYIGRKDILVL